MYGNDQNAEISGCIACPGWYQEWWNLGEGELVRRREGQGFGTSLLTASQAKLRLINGEKGEKADPGGFERLLAEKEVINQSLGNYDQSVRKLGVLEMAFYYTTASRIFDSSAPWFGLSQKQTFA